MYNTDYLTTAEESRRRLGLRERGVSYRGPMVISLPNVPSDPCIQNPNGEWVPVKKSTASSPKATPEAPRDKASPLESD